MRSLEAIGGKGMPSECVRTSKANRRSRVSRMLLVLAFAAALGGCEPVESLHPFFEAKDVVLDSDLEGTWVSKNDDGFYMKMLFQGGQDNTDGYKVELIFHSDQPETDKPEEGTITFSVHLFQAGDTRFADFDPLMYSAHSGPQRIEFRADDNPFGVPAHTVYRVKVDKSHLRLAWLDDDKVKDFIKDNNLPLAIYETYTLLLTGKTEELKASLLLHAESEGLLDDDMEFTHEQ